MLNNNIRVIYIIFLFAFCPFYISCNVKNFGEKDKFPQLVLQDSHSPIEVIAFSPDGKTLASGSSDNTIKLWDVDSDSAQSPKLHTLRGHLDTVVAVMFSPGGKTLISVGSDNVVKFWDVGTGEISKFPSLKGSNASFPLEGSNASVAAFSPDGKTLAVGNQNDGVDLWNIDTDEFNCTSVENHTFKDKGANAVAFSHDSKTLAISTSYSSHEVVEIWEVDTGKFMKGLEGHSDAIDIIAFSPDGSKLATASVDKIMTLWDVNSGESIRSFEHPSLVNSIAFSPDSQILASGSRDKMVRLWNVASDDPIETDDPIKTLEHTASIYAIAFSEDKTLASVTSDNTVKLWNVVNVEFVELVKTFNFEGHSSAVRIVAFSPKSRTLASVSSDRVWLWDMYSGRLDNILEKRPEDVTAKEHSADVTAIAFSPAGNMLASGSFDGKITLWQVETGGEIRSWEGYPEEAELSCKVNMLAFSPNGETLISIGGAKTLMKFWNVANGRMLDEQNLNDDKILAFSSDGNFMVAYSQKGHLKLLNLTNGKTEGEDQIDLAVSVKNAVFSLDGRTLAIYDSENNIRLLDVPSGKFRETLPEHPGDIIDIALSRDGEMLAVSAYNEVLLWDVVNKQMRKFQGHFTEVNSITFSPDGKILASGSSDGCIKFWRTTDGELLATSYGFNNGASVTYCPQGYYVSLEEEGYYVSSKRGDKFVSCQIGNEIYTLEQYSEVLRQPELVATILGGEAVPQPNIRLDKHLPPKLSWENPRKSTTREDYEIILKFKGLSPLDQVEFIHNGDEIPIDIKKLKETEIKIPLLKEDTNLFRARAWDKKGLKSNLIEDGFEYPPGINRTTEIFFKTKIPEDIRSSREVTINGNSSRIEHISTDGMSIRVLGSASIVKPGLNWIQNIKLWLEKKKVQPFAEPYKNSHAILVAIDDYHRDNDPEKRGKTGFKELKFMIKHAEELKKVLQGLGFPAQNIQTFYDNEAISEKINDALESFWQGGSKDLADRLFFYFGGHGCAKKGNGYLVTYDYDPDKPLFTAVSMEDLTTEHARKVAAHHMLIALDACHAGLAVYTSMSPHIDKEKIDDFRTLSVIRSETEPKARNVLLAGTGDEKALWINGGIFTQALIGGLQGMADWNKDRIVQFEELALHVRNQVVATAAATGVKQEPKHYLLPK